MGSDYTSAIAGMVGLIVLFTGMVGFVLTRPSDMASTPGR
jgi:hypothetical protein